MEKQIIPKDIYRVDKNHCFPADKKSLILPQTFCANLMLDYRARLTVKWMVCNMLMHTWVTTSEESSRNSLSHVSRRRSALLSEFRRSVTKDAIAILQARSRRNYSVFLENLINPSFLAMQKRSSSYEDTFSRSWNFDLPLHELTRYCIQ